MYFMRIFNGRMEAVLLVSTETMCYVCNALMYAFSTPMYDVIEVFNE